MTASPHDSSEPQLIRMADQHGRAVPLTVRQDGRTPGLVSPGRRTRFKIRAGALAYHVNRVVLPERPEDWHVNGIYVGGQRQFWALGDSPDDDGIPGAFFSGAGGGLSFDTTQVATDFVIDVTYRGPVEGGVPFSCHLQCFAVYEDEILGGLG